MYVQIVQCTDRIRYELKGHSTYLCCCCCCCLSRCRNNGFSGSQSEYDGEAQDRFRFFRFPPLPFPPPPRLLRRRFPLPRRRFFGSSSSSRRRDFRLRPRLLSFSLSATDSSASFCSQLRRKETVTAVCVPTSRRDAAKSSAQAARSRVASSEEVAGQ